jgi:hypothetical protein
MFLAIADAGGSVDVRKPLQAHYLHVRGARLQPICRKLKIKFAIALVGFRRSGRSWKPVTDGVVVSARSAPKLLHALEQRSARSRASAPARARGKVKREERRRQEMRRVADLGIDPRSRTGQWLLAGEIDEQEALLLAFSAEYRHVHTDYEDLLVSGFIKEDSRAFLVADPIPGTWGEYLAKYRFRSEAAKAMTRVLKDPRQAHPVWFREGDLALQRAGDSVDLERLTYEEICTLISQWRDDRSIG